MSVPRGEDLLRTLTREAAELRVPALDWERIEKNLAATFGREPAAGPSPVVRLQAKAAGARAGTSVFAIGIAAAAAVVLVASPRHERAGAAPITAATEGRESEAIPVDTSRDAAEASDVPLTFDKPGLVRFVIEPGSRIEMSSSDAPKSMTVTLVRGAIHAEVVPQPKGESFAIEVDRTRVAVHGTSFSVRRQGDRALVEVDHGSVAVGPVGHRGSTQGWLMVGPDRALFSLDGAQRAEWLDPLSPEPASMPTSTPHSPIATPPTPVASLGAPSPAPSLAATAALSPASPLAAAPPPSPAPSLAPASPPAPAPAPSPDASATAARVPVSPNPTATILSDIRGCYDKQLASGVRFSVRSALTLSVAASGTVTEGFFDPPLSPTLMACAREAIAKTRFSQGEARYVKVPVELSPPEE